MSAPCRPRVLLVGDARLRTARAVRLGCGLATVIATDAAALARLLADHDEPTWLLWPGTWPVHSGAAWPEPSATGRPLCALGAGRAPDRASGGALADAWRVALAQHGGDFGVALPTAPLCSVWLEPMLARAVAAALAAGAGAPGLAQACADAVHRVVAVASPRVVHCAALDVYVDLRPRVAQVVTSLQQGGAERVALDLHGALSGFGVASVLVPLYAPTRVELVVPAGTAPPLRLPPATSRGERLAQLDRALAARGVDVVHAHLLDGDDLAALTASGLAVVATVHNQRPGWPANLLAPAAAGVRLLVGCCAAVADDLRAAAARPPVRSVWNGIAPARLRGGASRAAAREQLGLAGDDLVLACIANPRPQKRLDRLPAIVAAVRARVAPRRVQLLLVGSVGAAASAAAERAQAELDALAAAASALDVSACFRHIGALDPPTAVLMAADVLVSVSDWEGLSLAWLEALACGTPVVARAVGGACEVAGLAAGMTAVPTGTDAVGFADAVLRASQAPVERFTALTTATMAAGYARLLRQAARPPRDGAGLWLVTNNLTTGGAQSSARRLLVELQRRGVRVRAAVVEESAAQPSAGVQALRALGITVCATAPADRVEPEATTAELLEAFAADPPVAVLFWNLRAALRLRLAEALFDLRVFDVSPGEMWSAALRTHFARPRPELTALTPHDYGARLDGVVVKYAGEAAAVRALLGAPVHVVPNGVDLAPSAPAQPAASLRIGTLARLSPQKRLEDLLDAFAVALPRLPSCVLRIAGGVERGTSDYADALRARTAGLPVEWLGDVAAGPFLADLDLFAMISEPAGCPNASLEAMACGLPVVATDHGGAGEQVIDGVTGRLVARGDVRALADALVELAGDPARRAAYGRAGRARVGERFSVARMADAYFAILGLRA